MTLLTGARVLIVVLNYRSIEDTVGCVAALLRSSFLDAGILVVDNGHHDEAHRTLAEGLPATVELIATGDNLGYAGGNNAGVREALRRRAEFVWIVNPDVRVEPETLTRLVDAADRAPDAGAVAPRIVLDGPPPSRIWFDGGFFHPHRAGATGHAHAGRSERSVPAGAARDVDWLTGACLLVRRRTFEHVGLLPEEYFLYFEDTDFSQRVLRAGWRLVLEPQARAVHCKPSVGTLPAPHYVYYMVRNKIHFARRMGLEVAPVAEGFEQSWIGPLRNRVASAAPDWLPRFDELVERAREDASRDVFGRCRDVEEVAQP